MLRPPLEVRRAGPEDVPDLLLLWATAREELPWHTRTLLTSDPETLGSRLRQVLAEESLDVLLARWEGRPAGYVVLRSAPLAPLFDLGTVHIEHLFVAPEERRRGVARALVTAAACLAERRGLDHVVCNVGPAARDAHRFLARLGFSPLTFQRVVATSTLRRRLIGQGRRPALEDLLSRRRSLRARGRIPAPAEACCDMVDPVIPRPAPAAPDLTCRAGDHPPPTPPGGQDGAVGLGAAEGGSPLRSR